MSASCLSMSHLHLFNLSPFLISITVWIMELPVIAQKSMVINLFLQIQLMESGNAMTGWDSSHRRNQLFGGFLMKVAAAVLKLLRRRAFNFHTANLIIIFILKIIIFILSTYWTIILITSKNESDLLFYNIDIFLSYLVELNFRFR